jgi:hypothetical protein
MRLYDATDALLEVRVWVEEHLDEIIASGGELPPALAEVIELAEAQFEQKTERVGLFVKELVVSAKAAKEASQQLAQRAKGFDATAEGLKSYLRRELYRADVGAVKRPLCTVRIQRNSGPSVTVTVDAAALPEKFRVEVPPPPPVPTYAVDRDALLAHWRPYYDDGLAIARSRGLTMALGEQYAHAYAEAHLPEGVSIELGSHVRIQ